MRQLIDALVWVFLLLLLLAGIVWAWSLLTGQLRIG